VEYNVVLDAVCFPLGFGVVPGDVLDGLTANGGIVVRGESKRGCSVNSPDISGMRCQQVFSMDRQRYAPE
jgi:hypothetical protein